MTHATNSTPSPVFTPDQVARLLADLDVERIDPTPANVAVAMMVVGLPHMDAVRVVCMAFLDCLRFIDDAEHRTLARAAARIVLDDESHTPGEHMACYRATISVLSTGERAGETLPLGLSLLSSCLYEPAYEGNDLACDTARGVELAVDLVSYLPRNDEERAEVVAALQKHIATLPAVSS